MNNKLKLLAVAFAVFFVAVGTVFLVNHSDR